MLQEIFEVILNVPDDPDVDAIETELVETFRYAADPACVTVTVWADNPDPVIVTIADRAVVDGFVEPDVTVTVAPFEPLVGETVSHEPSSIMLQDVLDVMANVPAEPEAAAIDTEFAERFKYGAEPAWVTVTL